MRSRPAVLLTPSIAARLSRPSCAVEHTFCATNVPRGAEKSPKRSLFDGWPGRPFPYLVTSLLPFSLFLKSFSRNTYGSTRKCCKQKTYGLAKPFRCNTYKKTGGGYPFSRWRSLPTSLGISPTLPFSFQLSTINLLCAAFHGSRITSHGPRLVFFLLSLLRYLLTSLLPETATPFPQRWGCCEKGVPSSGEKTVRSKIQFPGGGGGASVMPLNLCMCIPCPPGPPCVTV